MSVIKFELKQEHIKLLKHLRPRLGDNVIILSQHEEVIGVKDDIVTDDNKYEYIDLILNGVREGYDPFDSDDLPEYTSEEKDLWDKLFSELPMALDVILYTGQFETGLYKTKYHLRDWVKM